MIKQAELQQAYLQGRQAAIEKLAYDVFADSGLNIFDSGIERTTKVIQNTDKKPINQQLGFLEKLKSKLQGAKDRNRHFMNIALREDTHRQGYRNFTPEFIFPSSKKYDGFEPALPFSKGNNRLSLFKDENTTVDVDKILKDYPKAILLEKSDPRNSSKGTWRRAKEIFFRGEYPDVIGSKYMKFESPEWLTEETEKALEKALEGKTYNYLDGWATLPGRDMSKMLPQYRKSLSKLNKNKKKIQQLKNQLKDLPPDSVRENTSYLTPQNINRLAMLAGTGGGAYLGGFTPRAFGVSLAGSAAGNLLGGALGAGINSFRGVESNLVPLLGSTTGAIGGGLASGRYLS
jgi:hypothetical protein